jgi:hypothetical protein
MARSKVMLIQTIIVTELVFYRREKATAQNVLVSFHVYISVQYYERPCPFHEKHPHAVMLPPPNFTVGTTNAGRYYSAGIRHTQTLPSDCHMV